MNYNINKSNNQVPKGYKKTKVGIIPEDWDFIKLVDITFKITDGTHKTPKYIDSGIIFLSAKNIIGNDLNFCNIKYISKREHQDLIKRCFPEENDILLTKSGSLGSAIVIPKLEFEFSIFESLALLKINQNICSPYYLNQYINSGYAKKYFNAITTGLAVKHLHLVDLRKTKIPLPPLKEQQKIANILTTWDNAVSKQNELIKAKEELKKGLMQKLLSGEVRFEGFDREWENIKLGNICQITTGKLNANAMVDNGKYAYFTCARNIYKIDKFAFNTEALLVSGNGANVGYIHYYKGKFNAYQRTYVLDSFDNNDIIFVKYILDKYLAMQINREKNDGNTPYITLPTLITMKLKLPQLQEQQKIAKVLSTIDKEIELLKNELKSLKEQKKGLMQKLLTGEVRVNV